MIAPNRQQGLWSATAFALLWMTGAAYCGPSHQASPAPADAPRLAGLIAQLGDEDYYVRQRAQEELAQLSFEAFDALSEATLHEDLEVAARARYLLRRMRVEWTREDDSPQVRTLLKDYGWRATDERRAQIEMLARLPDHAGASALCRIVRFEQTNDLSKLAALAILAEHPVGVPPPTDLVRVIRQTLHESQRPAARWLTAWAEHAGTPDALIASFAGFIDEEEALLRQPAFSANTDVLAALLRFQVAWLERLNRPEQAIGVMRRLLALEKGEVDNLRKLLHWLIAQKAWSLVDELVARFEGHIRIAPVLLYLVAEAQADQGKVKLSEETAEQAFLLRPGNNPGRLNERRALAEELWRRQRPTWALREYRYVLDHGDKDNLVTLATRHSLARMLFDRGEALEAAKVLEELVDYLEKHPNALGQMDVAPKGPRARMHYFFACHYQALKDFDKQREHLDKALADDPDELDALIARYHLPNQDDQYRRETMEMIRASTETLREIIAGDPEEPTWYNQLAWLVGNTEGDMDEALAFSHKSLEFAPNEGAYLDTLAHVYFARKDYASAVKHQARAVELEPHSKLIRDKLEVFRAAAESQQRE